MATGYDPMVGERMRPAWVAVLALLDDGEWHSGDELVATGMGASDVMGRTVGNMISWGRRTGLIQRKGRRGRRWYRKAES